jgi:uncharacterized DUF497 family protein
MSVEWDPAKAASNLQKHGISFSDAELVLRDPQGVCVEDKSAKGEERYVVVGMDALGGITAVCFTYRGEAVRIISARSATRHERRQYEEGI